MAKQDICSDESSVYCNLLKLAFQINIYQTISCILVSMSILEHRKVDGFSINFQFLYAIALAFLCLNNREFEHLEILDKLDSIVAMVLIAKYLLLVVMLVTLFITVCYAKHDKFNMWWNTGGIVVSLVLALDHFSLDLTARDMWMFGFYMDVIAWMTLFKFSRHSKNGIVKVYGNIGYKFCLLKLLLFCYFMIQWVKDHNKITNEVTEANVMTEVSSGSSEPPVIDSTENCPKKPIYCIENEKNISNTSGLMSPN